MDETSFLADVAARLESDIERAALISGIVLEELHDRLPGLRLPILETIRTAREELPRRPGMRLGLFGELMQRAALTDASAAERAAIAVFATLRCFFGGDAAAAYVPDPPLALPADLDALWVASASKSKR